MLPKIIGIMAASPEGVIAREYKLPWNYPDELEHFRQTTKGQVMVMGRKTLAAAPDTLFKGNTPIVFSRDNSQKFSNHAVSNLEEFIQLAKSLSCQKIFMIGGAEIAHLLLSANLISEFILTKIHKSYWGDTYLDLNWLTDWPAETIQETPDYTIYNLKNPKGERHGLYNPS